MELMMDNDEHGFTYDEFVIVLHEICHDAESYKDLLNQLDSEIGDGDLGVTVSRGFKAVEKALEIKQKNIGQLLIKSGLKFTQAASSTMGVLFGRGMMRAGICLGDREMIDLPTFFNMVSSFEDAIVEKGKSQMGDKTMLDAIDPIRLSLQKSIENNSSTEKAIEDAYLAAKNGSEATRPMKALRGRSRWLGDQTIGHIDSGAVFISLIMKSIHDHCNPTRE
jgi:phosphoenolpyruvate---glycerone phosphotransferase subunit DhaL